MTWWVYLLRCADGTLYCGIALDVEARLALHEAGKGAKYTRGRGPLALVYTEACASRAEALRLERAIKRLPREAKLRLCAPAPSRPAAR
jgi:predicted GIY-YIG superfamily endonuclease